MVSDEQKNKLAGTAFVENGVIKVVNPLAGKEPASIIPTPDTIVQVDGIKVTGATEVTEDNVITVEFNDKTIPPELIIDVSRDKMGALLEVKPETRITYYLKDQPPARLLRLEVNKRLQETNPYGENDVMTALKNKGIARIDEQAVHDALGNPRSKQVIARGVLPTPPENERVDIKFSSRQDSKPVVRADGRVDFRECTKKIISVEPGNVIIEKTLGVPGQAGVDVYGERVEPKEPEKVYLQAGNGTELNEDGTILTANIAGQPEIQESRNHYHVSIQPNLVHEGNVSIDSGNLRFKGNIHVKGDVHEGMLVSATGEVQIGGLVSNADVVSGSDLVIDGNLLASKLEAGAAMTSVKELLPVIDFLQNSVSKLQLAAQHAVSRLQGKAPPGKVVALLLEQKFPYVHNQIKKFLEITSQNTRLPLEVEQLAVDMRRKLWGINVLQLQNIDDLRILVEDLHATKILLQALLENSANVRVKYALNSLIEATGDVYISGQGCIDTTIRAGGSVFADGIFRGGSIEARENVVMKEVGSKTGMPSIITVPKDKCIFLTKAYENVSLQIGEHQITTNRILMQKMVHIDVYEAVEIADWIPGRDGGGQPPAAAE